MNAPMNSANRMSRRDQRLAMIDAAEARLVEIDAEEQAGEPNEAYEFNLDARNAEWRMLSSERRATMALAA
jgi:hypothetical protein